MRACVRACVRVCVRACVRAARARARVCMSFIDHNDRFYIFRYEFVQCLHAVIIVCTSQFGDFAVNTTKLSYRLLISKSQLYVWFYCFVQVELEDYHDW